MPDLVVEHVAKHYPVEAGVVVALDGIDATIPTGALTALVGVSGSGKSTLLRLLAGLELPTAGRIDLAGMDLGRADNAAIRRYRSEAVAYVAQRAADNVLPHLTLAEHVGGATSTLEALGVGARLHGRASELSGGELARAALGVSLARGTSLVLVDEPTAELDEENAHAVITALRGAAARGATVVVATHDPAVIDLADHVVHLSRGRNASGAVAPHVPPRTEPGGVVLRATDVSKSYGATRVVDGVSLELRAGELGVIVGRSGSGKSTLLMMLGEWLAPDSGTVELSHGRLWSALGFVPQRFGLVPELSAAENVALPGRLLGAPDDVAALLDALGLEELAQRPVTRMSVGQQQRVAVARALALRPAVVVVDEPTSHQDEASAERVWAALARAAAEGAAVLVATHEPDAQARAHRGWAIDDGRI